MRFITLLLVATLTAPVLTAEGQAATPTTISGVVFDSLEMRVVPGATVQIADVNHVRSVTATTDPLGRFTFSDIAAGTYLVGFFHPKLDSLGFESQVLRVEVRTDEPIKVRLSIPSARSIVRTVCGAKSTDTSLGLMVGFLRGAENSMPRPEGKLSVRWSEIVIDQNSIGRETPTADAAASASGQFALCGLPVNTPIMIQASNAPDSSGSFEVTVPSTGLLHRDVYVAPVARAFVTVAERMRRHRRVDRSAAAIASR